MFLDVEFLKGEEIQLILEKRIEGNPVYNWVPAYFFTICDLNGQKVGGCDLRIGHNDMIYYCGNIGYHVDKEYRGHHYDLQACLLLVELAKKHQMKYLLLTCNHDNIASRRTCELLGAQLLEIVELPLDSYLRERGDVQKCIYKLVLE